MSTPANGLPPMDEYREAHRAIDAHEARRQRELHTTDTVATQTLAGHQIMVDRVTGILSHIGIPPLYTCSCGRLEAGDHDAAALHLVEMGVEAGVAAMAELREATTVMSELERAERDLVGYLARMEGADRELDVESWRDVLAILVSCAADADKRHLYPSTLGAHLWVELERLEGMASIREDGTVDQDPHDVGTPQYPVQACSRGRLHPAHSWSPVTSGAPRYAWCPGD